MNFKLLLEPKELLNYMLKGVLIIAPLVFTGLALYKIISFIDDPIQEIFYSIFGFRLYGLGLISIVVILIFVGFLASNIFFNAIMIRFEKLLFKIPLVKEIYKAIRDIFSAFVSDKKKFERPVIVTVSEGIYRIGFITNEDLTDFTQLPVIAVYFPLSYAFTGELMLVDASKIERIENGKVSEIMKYVISGGIIEK